MASAAPEAPAQEQEQKSTRERADDAAERAEDEHIAQAPGDAERIRRAGAAARRKFTRLSPHATDWVGKWQPWLSRSPLGTDLIVWWWYESELRRRLGDRTYQDHFARLLAQASPRDCAALSLGCTRRTDRSCRGPETCALDPDLSAERLRHRTGPVPGACDSFCDFDGVALHIDFTSDDRHRAVVMRDQERGGRMSLWVNGVPAAHGASLDWGGYWLDDRHYVIQAEGPDGHPEQALAMGTLCCAIMSLVIHDAELAETRVLVPEPTELWNYPQVRRHGDTLHVYADPEAAEAGRPDRVLPVAPPPD
ncbi:hypothetical protein ABZ532_28180 [Streptomyces sp. NPDC019396]|uniref:hypothetical protein n=1 Tax=Streptomyces sp. NPDC019396 TaxID=3154687 RepID=UPI0033EC3D20